MITGGLPGIHIFFDASLIGAAKAMEATDSRIVYPGHPAWPYDQDEDDEIWLLHVGGDDWLSITRDRKMRYRTPEKEALIQNRVRAINLATKANLNVQATVDLLEANWDAIEDTMTRPPAFYHLTSAGLRVMLNYP